MFEYYLWRLCDVYIANDAENVSFHQVKSKVCNKAQKVGIRPNILEKPLRASQRAEAGCNDNATIASIFI